jgi:hypothetical protein
MNARIAALFMMLSLTKLAFAVVGFQEVTVPDPEGKPILVAMWYPTQASPSSHQIAYGCFGLSKSARTARTRSFS